MRWVRQKEVTRMNRSLAAAVFLTFASILGPAPAIAQIEEVTIGIDGMT